MYKKDLPLLSSSPETQRERDLSRSKRSSPILIIEESNLVSSFFFPWQNLFWIFLGTRYLDLLLHGLTSIMLMACLNFRILLNYDSVFIVDAILIADRSNIDETKHRVTKRSSGVIILYKLSFISCRESIIRIVSKLTNSRRVIEIAESAATSRRSEHGATEFQHWRFISGELYYSRVRLLHKFKSQQNEARAVDDGASSVPSIWGTRYNKSLYIFRFFFLTFVITSWFFPFIFPVS